MYRLDIYEENSEKILLTQWFDSYHEAREFSESNVYLRKRRCTITVEDFVTLVL